MKEIKVPDMMCNNCVNRIKKALEDLGVSCEVLLDKKIVLVEEDSLDKAFAEIYDIGFTPEK